MPKTATEKNRVLADVISRYTRIVITPHTAGILRRASMTLSRWAEEECNGAIQRDEPSGHPRRYRELPDGSHRRGSIIPDREQGALKRVAALCKALKLYFYHQTDPRGCALYVSAAPLCGNNYSAIGIAICG